MHWLICSSTPSDTEQSSRGSASGTSAAITLGTGTNTHPIAWSSSSPYGASAASPGSDPEVGKDGRPTTDGQLEVIPPRTPMPDFKDIKKGTVLRALSPVNMRRPSPSTYADLKKSPFATLRTGSCVMTVTDPDPEEEAVVSKARSGGWLEVTAIRCPGA
jgi:hypothetical protein